MRIDVVTIFPEYLEPLNVSLVGKARARGQLDVHLHHLREWTTDVHRTVDDTPYGGGPGMVMKPDPWGEALDTLVPSPPTNDASTAPNGPPPTNDTAPVNGHAPTDRGTPANGSVPTGEGASVNGIAPAEGIAPAGGVASSGGSMLRGGALPASDIVRPAEVTSSVESASSDGCVGASTEQGAQGGGGLLPGSVGAPSSGERVSAESAAPGAPGAVPRLIIPTPSGRPFMQADAVRYAAEPWLVFACGRYEGIDARVVEEARTRMPVDEVSLGDFVLAGGEVAVMVMIEAIARLVPGVLGNAQSVTDDSFAPGAMESLLEGPAYTKPPVWRDRPVPDVLLSGNHGAIARWRRDEALRRTARHRPELLARLAPEDLDKRDRAVLHEAGFPVDGEDMAD